MARIGQYVLEENRAWCCSHKVDHEVVTIEVSSIQSYQEPYECTEAAFDSLIDLCVDICQRNGIKKLIWKEGKQYCPAFTGNWGGVQHGSPPVYHGQRQVVALATTYLANMAKSQSV